MKLGINTEILYSNGMEYRWNFWNEMEWNTEILEQDSKYLVNIPEYYLDIGKKRKQAQREAAADRS